MERGLTTAQAEVKAVEAIFSGLTFDLINCTQANISGTMVLGVAAGIWPTIIYIQIESLILSRSLMNCYMLPYRLDYIINYLSCPPFPLT